MKRHVLRLLFTVGAVALAAAAVSAGVAVSGAGSGPFAAQETPTTTATDGHGGGGHDHGGSGGGHGDRGGMMDMQMVPNGTIVNENTDQLPPGCDEIAGERNMTIRGGNRFAEAGEMFAFDTERLQVAPCTRLTVTFVNEDSVRHQWMIHGLPKEIYPMGMFNIEVNGPGSVTGTLITPSGDHTFGTHCSLPQHEQKGMHMELVVGSGGENGGHSHGNGTSSGDGHDHTHGTTGTGPGFGFLGALAAAALLAAVRLGRRS